jgi:DNA primase
MLKEGYDLSDEDMKTQYTMEAAKILSQVESAVQRERYIGRLNKETGFSVESLKAQAGGLKEENSPVKYRYNSISSAAGENAAESKTEGLLLLYVMKNPQSVITVQKELSEEDFSEALYRKIFYLIIDQVKKGILPAYAEIVSLLTEPDEINRTNELFQNVVEDQNMEKLTEGCIRKMQIASLERKRSSLLKKLENTNDKQMLKELSVLNKDIYEKRSRPF